MNIISYLFLVYNELCYKPKLKKEEEEEDISHLNHLHIWS